MFNSRSGQHESSTYADDLCFKRKTFMKNDFKVDHFVAECRVRVQLEILRQDLEVYFKQLKNEMIVLINKDYADFVNLSSNLVGMDKAIFQLREPLKQIQSYFKALQDLMQMKRTEFNEQLITQQQLSDRQNQLAHMMGLIKAVEKVEQISSQEDTGSGQSLERIASEFNQLQHHASFCKRKPVINHVRPRISEITSNLQQSLELVLMQGISDNDIVLIQRCLNSYALISKTKDAEKLVQTQLVHMFMQQIIQEQNNELSPSHLKSFFDKVLEAVAQYIKSLCNVTSGRCEVLGNQYRGIAGYDFMVNSVWPEIVLMIENNLANMFSPANPDLFHKRYHICMNFISSFEMQCRSQASVKRLRQSESYNRFLAHWSLPVYFQIRFQEIGRKLEAALQSSTNKNVDEDNCLFRLHGTCELDRCLQLCWSDKVFIAPLIHRFWKVTLQLLARFYNWVKLLLNKNSVLDVPPLTLHQYVSLFHDIGVLRSNAMKLFNDKIKYKILNAGLKDCSAQTSSLGEILSSYQDFEKSILDHVVETMTTESCAYLKQVQDVPRLYRRTNREAPTKFSAYVIQVMRPAITFKEDNCSHISEDKAMDILTMFFFHVSEKYFLVLSDVLSSIKKMEESLQRLQKMRSSTKKDQLDTNGVAKITDDDKIRMQFSLDVVEYGKKMNEIGVSENIIPKYLELKAMVQQSLKKAAN